MSEVWNSKQSLGVPYLVMVGCKLILAFDFLRTVYRESELARYLIPRKPISQVLKLGFRV